MIKLNAADNRLVDVQDLGTDLFNIPIAQWSDTVDLTKIPRALKINGAGTYYLMGLESTAITTWVTTGPEIVPLAVKRVGASTAAGLDGLIQGIL